MESPAGGFHLREWFTGGGGSFPQGQPLWYLLFGFLFLADERRFYSQILADKKNQRLSAFFICADQREIIDGGFHLQK